MITRPFDFCRQLRRPESGIEVLPYVDACLILVCFALLSSKFVLAPGIGVSLPLTAGAPPDVTPASRVLSVSKAEGGNEMLIFDGKIFQLETLARYLADGRQAEPNEALLIQADANVSVDLLVRVFEIAKGAGFYKVQIAAEPEYRPSPN